MIKMKQNNKHEHHTYYIDAAAMEYKTPPGLAKSLHSDISRESFNTIIEVINQSFIMVGPPTLSSSAQL